MGKLPITITMIRMKWLNMLNINTKYQLSGKNERNEDKMATKHEIPNKTHWQDVEIDAYVRLFISCQFTQKKESLPSIGFQTQYGIVGQCIAAIFHSIHSPITKFRRLVAFFALFFFYPVSSECANRYRLSIDWTVIQIIFDMHSI